MVTTCMSVSVTYVRDAHEYPVRNAAIFRLQRVNKMSTTKTLFYKGLNTFKCLPNELKAETNIYKFKKKTCQIM